MRKVATHSAAKGWFQSSRHIECEKNRKGQEAFVQNGECQNYGAECSRGNCCYERESNERYITAPRQVQHLTARLRSLSVSMRTGERGRNPPFRCVINSQFRRASSSPYLPAFRDADFHTVAEIRNLVAVSRSSVRPSASRCSLSRSLSPGWERPPWSLLTSRTNNARESRLVTPKYATPKDVTYDTARSARTVHISVGDEPLIVALLSCHSLESLDRPAHSLTNRMPGNRDRVTRQPRGQLAINTYVVLNQRGMRYNLFPGFFSHQIGYSSR